MCVKLQFLQAAAAQIFNVRVPFCREVEFLLPPDSHLNLFVMNIVLGSSRQNWLLA
jgi:hypothetical protein